MKTRIALTSMLVALLLVGMLVPVAMADRPGIETSVQGTPQAVPAAANPEDVLWDQYANFSGVGYAAQDFEPDYDVYDIWAADDFENLDAWSIDTIVTRGGWSGVVDISVATAINWYICADAAGLPGCVPGDGSEFWTLSLPPSDPQVGLGVFEPEDVVLTLDTAVELPAGTWWLVWQVALEFGLYGQYGWSGTADPVWGTQSYQINPNGGFGNGSDWYATTYSEDLMFRLEGTGGGVEPRMFVSFIHMRYSEPGGYWVTSKLRIIDEFGNPVDGAMVDAALTLPGGWSPSQSRMTNPNGTTFFGRLSTQEGTYELCVLDVTAPGYVYEPGMNYETCETIYVGPE